MMDERVYFVLKRDLYWMPNDCGYTGIRDHAQLYTLQEARARTDEYGAIEYDQTRQHLYFIHKDDAPEFTHACYDDLARDHLQTKITALRAQLAAAEADKLAAMEMVRDFFSKDIETASRDLMPHASVIARYLREKAKLFRALDLDALAEGERE